MNPRQWVTHSRRSVYRSEWLHLDLDDVELPDGERIEHHVVSFPKPGQAAVVLDDTGERVLMIWRHRYITDVWGWEIPAGWVESGEDPEASIAREVLEETGYLVGALRPLAAYDVWPGLSPMRLRCWLATGARRMGEPSDTNEVVSVQWHSLADVPDLIRQGSLRDGTTLIALAHYWLMRGTASSPVTGTTVPSGNQRPDLP